MRSLPSLRQNILRATLPRISILSVIALVVIGTALFLFARQQLLQVHQNYADEFTSNLEQNLQLTAQQLDNIANNDLIINGLIDVEYRDYYLPLFIQSLQITEARDVPVALYDFAGEPLLEKNWQSVPPKVKDIWQEDVMVDLKLFSEITSNGVLLAAPIELVGAAEGALVMYLDNLQWLISAPENPATQFLVDHRGVILASTSEQIYENGKVFTTTDLSGYFYFKTSWEEYTVYSVAPLTLAYSTMLWLIPVAIVAMALVIMSALYSAHLSANLSSSSLRRLLKHLQTEVRQPGSDVRPPENVRELEQIHQAFTRLIQDISKLSLSNSKFSNVIHSMQDLLIVMDNEQNLLLINQRGKHHLEKYQLSPTQVFRAVTDDRSHDNAYHESRYCLEGEKEVAINWHLSPLQNNQGEFIGHVLVGEDVSQRLQLEQDIRIRTQAIEEASVGVSIVDIRNASYPFVYVNEAFQKMLRRTKHELINYSSSELFGANAGEEQLARLMASIEEGVEYENTLLMEHSSDGEQYIHLSLSPIYSNDGELTHYLGIHQDVTAQQEAAIYLEQARKRAEESTQLKSIFLASMSHEIRTPINGIYGMLELLSASKLDDNQRNYVTLAADSTRNLLHIINDILDFSKIEAGKMAIDRQDFDLELLLVKTVAHYQVEGQAKNVPIALHTEECQRPVNGDPVRLRQVISNLLANAVKFTEQGNISVVSHLSSEGEGYRLRVTVKDTGIGIDPNKLKTVFSMFNQEDISTTRKFGGTGLGLSISQQLVELMGGSISVESDKGKGSVFRFDVKLYQPFHKHVADTAATEGQSSTDAATPGMKILLVEDNEINRIVATELLKEFDITVKENGEQAIAELNQNPASFDLVLMDCHMPVMDGFEATRLIRAGEAGERYSQIPIIAMTANAMSGDKEKCLNQGMSDYISKPFSAKDLLSKVSSWQNKRHPLSVTE